MTFRIAANPENRNLFVEAINHSKMIKFFRKIRYDLMEKNKTGKYFKYAIGEIILVVIGILIALQINNWNENQKLKFVEKETLIALENDILKSFDDIKHDAELNQLSLTAALQIDKYINNNSALTDTIIAAFEIASYDYRLVDVEGAYKSLQSKGVELILNKDLRANIIAFYEIEVPHLQRTELNGKLFHNLLFPYYQKQFRINQSDLEIPNFPDIYLNAKYNYAKMGFVPLSESILKLDPEFKVILRDVIYNRTQVLRMYLRSEKLVQKLLDDLRIEINK